MKTTYLRKYTLSLVMVGFAFAIVCKAGPAIIITPPSIVVSAPPPPPAVVISAPAPPVVAVSVAPDNYYWDGYEYVGIVGGQYYYLGDGNAWVVMDPVRLHRFNDWQRVHTDWRSHAVVNVKFRGGYHDSHATPMHDNHYSPAVHDDHNDHGDHDHNNPPH